MYNEQQPTITDNASKTRSEHITMVKDFINEQGISLDDLKDIQTNQSEITEPSLIGPSELQGVSNVVSKDNAQLTSELAELTRRFNNLVHGKFDGEF